MIDEEGYRPNVGIILASGSGEVLWARRRGQDAWQFPQGGIQERETPEQAMYRELHEEIGLEDGDVSLLGCTSGWLKYRLPPQYMRHRGNSRFVGQKQKWFLLKLISADERVSVDHGESPEFDHWRWVSYWYPLSQIVAFKREVYRRALLELVPRYGRLLRDVDRDRRRAAFDAEGPAQHSAGSGLCAGPEEYAAHHRAARARGDGHGGLLCLYPR